MNVEVGRRSATGGRVYHVSVTLRKGQIRFSGKGKDQGVSNGDRPLLHHVKAFGGAWLRRTAECFDSHKIHSKDWDRVPLSRSLARPDPSSSSVLGSRSTLLVASVMRPCVRHALGSMCFVRDSKRTMSTRPLRRFATMSICVTRCKTTQLSGCFTITM